MFEGLGNRLDGIFQGLRGRGRLTEDDVKVAAREIRVALLEADVALPVVKDFIAKVKERAVGEEVVRSVKPGQMVVKIVNDVLVETLGSESQALDVSSNPPLVYMMVGLQGSGKTTTSAKLGKHLTQKAGKKVLMASLDTRRPAAQEQLAVLGEQTNVETLAIVPGQSPVDIAKRGLDEARRGGFDILILDTAGRLSIDDELMVEVESVRDAVSPKETLLVADAMTGQDAVTTAQIFNERVGLSGIALTRIDGDGRGGAALSMRAVTGAPIKLLGTGEKLDQIEAFHPDRIASRILGMGDIVSLVEQASEHVKQEDAEKLVKKLQKGKFDLNDLASQLRQMQKMGGLGQLMKMLPGAGKMQKQMAAAGMDEKVISRQLAIIDSMTVTERSRPELIKASRKIRISKGSGTQVQDVNKLLKQFNDAQRMMKKMGKLQKAGKLPPELAGLDPKQLEAMQNMDPTELAGALQGKGGGGGLPGLGGSPAAASGKGAALPGLGGAPLPGLGGPAGPAGGFPFGKK